MGILARLKRNKEVKKEVPRPIQPGWQPRTSVREFESKDGRVLVGIESYDIKAHEDEFYDTTHVIIDKTPIRLQGGETVYDAYVSHFSEDDAIMINKDTGKDMGRRNNYKHVRIGVDFDRIKSDPDYTFLLANTLLDENRICKYIHKGLSDQQYCGNYVGEIALIDGKYRKQFTTPIGNQVHFLPDQIRARQDYQRMQDRHRQEQIAAKQAEIAKAQEELRRLQKDNSEGR